MTFFRHTISLYWLMLALLLSPLPVQAQAPARLYLQNVPLQDEQLVVVNVQLDDAVDLYGAEIQLKYDPAQLRVRDDNPRLKGVQIAPGPLLAFDDRFVATNRVNAETGLIDFVFTLLRPAPPISGQGVLATVVFEISAAGPFLVEVSKVQLVSSELQPLPVVTENLQLNHDLGSALVVPPATSIVPRSDWWGSLLLLIALVAFALLLVRVRLRQAAPAEADASPTASRQRSGQSRSSRQSAVLLTRQGNHLLEQGNLPAAYELFSQAVELDPANGEAWLGKGLVAQQDIERHICFQRVLALDPDNEVARRALQQ